VSCFDNYTNSGGLFAQYVNMFLKLEHESSGYPSWVHSEEDKADTLITTGAEGISLDKASIFRNAGQRTLSKLKVNLCWVKGFRTTTRPKCP
jgi:hypothetical protein